MTETPATAGPLGADPSPSGAVASVLEQLRLSGAIFLRAEYSEPWSYQSLDGPTTAGILHPGAERVILFHVVAAGSCWVALEDGERHWARAGEVIVLPYGDQHSMGSAGDAERVPLGSILVPPPWTEFPIIRHGAGGTRTDVVCGYLTCDDPLFDPTLRALPRVFVVQPPDGPAAQWVRASIDYALAESDSTGSPTMSTRITEVLLTEVLKIHLVTAPAADRGWLGALRDPVLAPAMALLHSQPDRKWTVAELAAKVAVSKSALDERFRRILGRSPIRYLTDWRMHVAEDLLATTELGIVPVARRVGYESEEAFSRAFKRSHGLSPRDWRAARTSAPAQ